MPKCNFLIIVSYFVLLASSLEANSFSIELNSDLEQVLEFSPKVQIYVDSTRTLTYPEIQSKKFLFKPLDIGKFYRTNKYCTYWLNFKLKNNSNDSLAISLDFGKFDYIYAFEMNGNKVLETKIGLLEYPSMYLYRENIPYLPLKIAPKNEYMMKVHYLFLNGYLKVCN